METSCEKKQPVAVWNVVNIYIFDFAVGLRIKIRAPRVLKTIKLLRAQGGCHGTERRRKTWQAALSYGEPQAGFDP